MKEFFQEKEDKGENVVIHALFTRHGEKKYDPMNTETDLTEEGKRKSSVEGSERPRADMIKSYSSRTKRTMETAEIEADSSITVKKGAHRFRDELGFPHDKNGEFSRKIQEIKKTIIGDKDETVEKDKFEEKLEKAAIVITDYYLSFGDKKPDSLAPSPEEAAAGIAKMVDNYLRMAERLNSGSEVDLINATHDLNLAAFLKEVLVREIDGKKVVGFDSVKEVGGAFGFNENFEILIKIDSAGKESSKLLFRGKEYEIDNKRLQELVAMFNERKHKNE